MLFLKMEMPNLTIILTKIKFKTARLTVILSKTAMEMANLLVQHAISNPKMPKNTFNLTVLFLEMPFLRVKFGIFIFKELNLILIFGR